MLIYVDIDETICFYEGKRDYPDAIPNHTNIAKINKLYDEGNEIVYWTARGGTTGLDWTTTTEEQLKNWNCKHHRLEMHSKPSYDLLICDKTKRIEEIMTKPDKKEKPDIVKEYETIRGGDFQEWWKTLSKEQQITINEYYGR